MRIRQRMNQRNETTTYIELDGIEQAIVIDYDFQPAEPDVNVGESVDINTVWLKSTGKIITDELDNDTLDDLRQEVFEQVCSEAEDPRY